MQVRIDIFVSRGSPSGCVLNEISLSSGNPLGAHDQYVAKTWSDQYAEPTFQVREDDDTPVYDVWLPAHCPPPPPTS